MRATSPVEPSKIVATHLTYRSGRGVPDGAAPGRAVVLPQAAELRLGAPRGCPAGRVPLPELRGEIAVVIGERCLGTSVNDALRYVGGYTVANDWSVHDFRRGPRSMLRVKGQDGFCPLGPVLVGADEVDPDDLTIRTYVNGELVQEGHTGSDLLFSFAYQIADVSRLITLEPGDVLSRGRPPLAAGRARRRRGGRGRRDRAPGEPGRRARARAGAGRRPAGGNGEHDPRRSRHPGGRGGAAGGCAVKDTRQLEIRSVVDQVHEELLQRIVGGELPPGSRLRQEALAEELGVSRTPLREALARLVSEGLVDFAPNRGATVARRDFGDMEQAWRARLVLEPGAARLAAERRDPEEIALMREIVGRQRDVADDVTASFGLNRDFHLALVAAGGNLTSPSSRSCSGSRGSSADLRAAGPRPRADPRLGRRARGDRRCRRGQKPDACRKPDAQAHRRVSARNLSLPAHRVPQSPHALDRDLDDVTLLEVALRDARVARRPASRSRYVAGLEGEASAQVDDQVDEAEDEVPVDASCMTSPETVVVRRMSSKSRPSGEAMHGPSGENVSKLFPRVN